MTGFGAGTAEREVFAVRAELRTVNHRHLIVKTRLPADLSHLDHAVEAQVKKRLGRGSVTVHVQLLRATRRQSFELDEELAHRYHLAAKKLAKRLKLEGELHLRDLMNLPGVLSQQESGGASATEDRVVREAVATALDALVAMREKEGMSLTRELLSHAKAMERASAGIEKAMPKVVKRQQQALRKRVAELLERQQSLPENEVAREVALLADRLDVSEEIARLSSHVGQLYSLLDSKAAVGRKLDFLAQELFREANTIGAKCNDAKVSHAVVDLKTHIERLREQVQNVE